MENSKKIDPLRNPFFSTEIRRGVNLSCLRGEHQRNAAKKASPKKPPVEGKGEDKGIFYDFLKRTLIDSKDEEAAKSLPDKNFSSILSSLLPKGEDRGDLFYDTEGKPVGYTNDFIINRCRITREGWMVLPGVDPSLFTSSGGASSDEASSDEASSDEVSSDEASSDEASSSLYAMGGEEEDTTRRDLDMKETTPAAQKKTPKGVRKTEEK
ncbi:hypothetical protein TNCV_1822741 [Trichonephila clavipes]|uniref:Uncharacterized protein n=1 Tax=Trichonephila clavipes TaxID=2585209 RepID=A0A8X6S636_TRICX|nr:hypothetical protein TNCV_1822741 [Trichonephila clavipes]